MMLQMSRSPVIQLEYLHCVTIQAASACGMKKEWVQNNDATTHLFDSPDSLELPKFFLFSRRRGHFRGHRRISPSSTPSASYTSSTSSTPSKSALYETKRRITHPITNRYCCSCGSPAGAVDAGCVNCDHTLCHDCEVINEEMVDYDFFPKTKAPTGQEPRKDRIDRITQTLQQKSLATQEGHRISKNPQGQDFANNTVHKTAHAQAQDTGKSRDLDQILKERQRGPVVVEELKKHRLNMVKCVNCRHDKKKVYTSLGIAFQRSTTTYGNG
jgi:hypothetical protein